ncbi:UPF0692 C19orf54 homolog isoform X1 [Babesia ovis]|uniref:UPF0692 C19orf54 homolog isoform X1 n=1 Tax=Babesia ovis TaxID=5869 RepID=A0A9W5TAK9_BABOV|nr:UPF0692 C19orf54 homolog isoform X1 [Babesia ovis]
MNGAASVDSRPLAASDLRKGEIGSRTVSKGTRVTPLLQAFVEALEECEANAYIRDSTKHIPCMATVKAMGVVQIHPSFLGNPMKGAYAYLSNFLMHLARNAANKASRSASLTAVASASESTSSNPPFLDRERSTPFFFLDAFSGNSWSDRCWELKDVETRSGEATSVGDSDDAEGRIRWLDKIKADTLNIVMHLNKKTYPRFPEPGIRKATAFTSALEYIEVIIHSNEGK